MLRGKTLHVKKFCQINNYSVRSVHQWTEDVKGNHANKLDLRFYGNCKRILCYCPRQE